MKRVISIMAVVLLVGVIAIPLMAQGPVGKRGGSMMYGRAGDCLYGGPAMRGGYADLTDEQREQLGALHKKFYDDTAQVRKDFRDKKIELYDILDAANPDTARAKAVQAEISALQAQLAQKRVELGLERRKILPEAGYGQGFGPGTGPGRARGGFGPSFGPGVCWR